MKQDPFDLIVLCADRRGLGRSQAGRSTGRGCDREGDRPVVHLRDRGCFPEVVVYGSAYPICMPMPPSYGWTWVSELDAGRLLANSAAYVASAPESFQHLVRAGQGAVWNWARLGRFTTPRTIAVTQRRSSAPARAERILVPWAVAPIARPFPRRRAGMVS